MALNIQSLVEQGANVRIEVTAADLKMFGESIAEQAIMAYKCEIAFIGDDGILSSSRGRGRPRSKSNYPSLLGRGEASFNQPKCSHLNRDSH